MAFNLGDMFIATYSSVAFMAFEKAIVHLNSAGAVQATFSLGTTAYGRIMGQMVIGQDGSLYVPYSYTVTGLNADTQYHLGRLDPDGTWTPSVVETSPATDGFRGANGSLVLPDTDLLIHFARGTVAVSGNELARYETDGTLVNEWNIVTNGAFPSLNAKPGTTDTAYIMTLVDYPTSLDRQITEVDINSGTLGATHTITINPATEIWLSLWTSFTRTVAIVEVFDDGAETVTYEARIIDADWDVITTWPIAVFTYDDDPAYNGSGISPCGERVWVLFERAPSVFTQQLFSVDLVTGDVASIDDLNLDNGAFPFSLPPAIWVNDSFCGHSRRAVQFIRVGMGAGT